MARNEEEVLVDIIRATEIHLGARLGHPTRQDGNLDRNLTVDFTFETHDPRVALELTSLTSHFDGWSEPAGQRFAKALGKQLRQLGIPQGWRIALHPETQLGSGKELRSVKEIIEVMHTVGIDSLSTATWSSGLPWQMIERTLELLSPRCDEARAYGIRFIERTGTGVALFPFYEFSNDHSLNRPLVRAMEDNSKKLSIATQRGYWTMLAVDVQRPDTAPYIQGKSPDFRPGIDHLWLVVHDPGSSTYAYYANRSDRYWKRVQIPPSPHS